MRLLVQPEDGVKALVNAIDSARKRVEIAIFRLDHTTIKDAIGRAVDRGVSVHALVANTNHGQETKLRTLEMDLLAMGVEVSRTADDLARHHYKFMVVDGRELNIFTFNYTYLDIEHSRSFGLVIDDRDIVSEARALFSADVKRQPYSPKLKSLVVSPVNARDCLSHLIRRSEKQLLIYDPEITDRAMIRLLRERGRAGVEIRIIGQVAKPMREFEPRKLMRMRFHTRTIVRDNTEAFMGSQGLRDSELDRRRELGIIVEDSNVVHSLANTFESDWASALPAAVAPRAKATRSARGLRKSVKAIVKALPLSPIVEAALKRAVDELPTTAVRGKQMVISDGIKEAIEDAVSGMIQRSGISA